MYSVNETTSERQQQMPPPSDDKVEVRFDVSRAVFDVYDAKRMALRMSKQAMGESIFTDWARQELHLAKVVMNVTRGKGIDSPSGWGELGD